MATTVKELEKKFTLLERRFEAKSWNDEVEEALEELQHHRRMSITAYAGEKFAEGYDEKSVGWNVAFEPETSGSITLDDEDFFLVRWLDENKAWKTPHNKKPDMVLDILERGAVAKTKRLAALIR